MTSPLKDAQSRDAEVQTYLETVRETLIMNHPFHKVLGADMKPCASFDGGMPVLTSQNAEVSVQTRQIAGEWTAAVSSGKRSFTKTNGTWLVSRITWDADHAKPWC
jgi:hypothetical protein